MKGDPRDLARGMAMSGAFGRNNDDERAKMFAFLTLFHPEMTEEQKLDLCKDLPRNDMEASQRRHERTE